MTGKDIFQNMGGIDPQFILDAAPGEEMPAPRRSLWLKWGAAAACLALICLLAVPFLGDHKNSGADSNGLPAGQPENEGILSGDGEAVPGAPEGDAPCRGYGKHLVEVPLYEALEKAQPEEVFRISARFRGNSSGDILHAARLQLSGQKISFEETDGLLILHITAEQFLSLELEPGAEWIYGLAAD